MASRRLRIGVVTTIGTAAAVFFAFGYVDAASALQEDLQSPAQYISHHREKGDVIALPDHAITSAVEYYLMRDDTHIPLWSQVGVRQRYVEGFDLSLHPSGGLPRRVWLVADGSVPGVTRFEGALKQSGYLVADYKQFNGSSVLMYHSTQPTTKFSFPRAEPPSADRPPVLWPSRVPIRSGSRRSSSC